MDKIPTSPFEPTLNRVVRDIKKENHCIFNTKEHNEKLLELVRKGAPSRPPDESRGEVWFQTDPMILERVKRAAKSKDLEIPLNAWITEAIIAQLKKEGF